MNTQQHEKLAQRLVRILTLLNQGMTLEYPVLADEFGVHPRTIQRDVQRLSTALALEREGGGFRLHASQLGRLLPHDLQRFAHLVGVSRLFPGRITAQLFELLRPERQQTVLVKGPAFETLEGEQERMFQLLQEAIMQRWLVSFRYRRRDGVRRMRNEVAPYRLVNHNGIWYLAGTEQQRLKAYAFTRMDGLLISDQPFQWDVPTQQAIEEDESIWYTHESLRAQLRVGRPAVPYFKRRPLLRQQRVDQELPDGSLLVSVTVAHWDQLLPIVRYWIPHVRVVDPPDIQARLEEGLRAYLAGDDTTCPFIPIGSHA